jgi:para-nitrobenzyl esterase
MKIASLVTILSLVAYADAVKTADGQIEGTVNPATGIRMFKGVPFAQPPVGDLRWKEPQPLEKWRGVRRADQFGPRCPQRSVFGDMNFRSNGMGEDCLYLNIWTPAKSGNAKLPVMVYFYGAGDGSEPRYDGESLATKGIVAVTVNYRLDIFGFFSHPELTRESSHHASGNYGLLDQNAALVWVKRNIAAFGGDPNKITIGGESAGSLSVSAQMASPLSKDLIASAIGESGSYMGTLSPAPLAEIEQAGVKFAATVGATSLAALRAMTVEQLLNETGKGGGIRFSAAIDGYFFPQPIREIYAEGKQAHVPLLVGWNSQEGPAQAVLGNAEPTQDNLASALRRLYPDHADEALKVYGAATDREALDNATALASDRFIAYSTWTWSNLCEKTGGKPVFRYYYSHPRPAMRPEMGDATAGLAGGVVRGRGRGPATPARGAVHSAEIEYALGNLDSNKVYAWTGDDHHISRTMEEYFANFIKTGDPNGGKLPKWPAANSAKNVPVMIIDVESRAEPEKHRNRYEFLDSLNH